MITGVCLNPSFDKTVEVDALALGEVNRIRSVRVDMGGKGVNVAVVARRLGLDALCIGCMGEQGERSTLPGSWTRRASPIVFSPCPAPCAPT